MCSLPKLEADTSETTMSTSSPSYTPASGNLRPWAVGLVVTCLSFLMCKTGVIIVCLCVYLSLFVRIPLIMEYIYKNPIFKKGHIQRY